MNTDEHTIQENLKSLLKTKTPDHVLHEAPSLNTAMKSYRIDESHVDDYMGNVIAIEREDSVLVVSKVHDEQGNWVMTPFTPSVTFPGVEAFESLYLTGPGDDPTNINACLYFVIFLATEENPMATLTYAPRPELVLTSGQGCDTVMWVDHLEFSINEGMDVVVATTRLDGIDFLLSHCYRDDYTLTAVGQQDGHEVSVDLNIEKSHEAIKSGEDVTAYCVAIGPLGDEGILFRSQEQKAVNNDQ